MYIVKTEIKNSAIHGKGYFALENIPMGTIVYCYGESDERYSKSEFAQLTEAKKSELLEYAVEDEFGNWVETKSGPFTNHSCDANILPLFITGYYSDIAVRDIKKGEEITVDYGLFYSSTLWTMSCKCGSNLCRQKIGFGLANMSKTELLWQSRITQALERMQDVKQPIKALNDKYAKLIVNSLRDISKPTVAKHIKFSLIAS